MDLYDEQRSPYLLPCLHVLCTSCLLDVKSSEVPLCYGCKEFVDVDQVESVLITNDLSACEHNADVYCLRCNNVYCSVCSACDVLEPFQYDTNKVVSFEKFLGIVTTRTVMLSTQHHKIPVALAMGHMKQKITKRLQKMTESRDILTTKRQMAYQQKNSLIAHTLQLYTQIVANIPTDDSETQYRLLKASTEHDALRNMIIKTFQSVDKIIGFGIDTYVSFHDILAVSNGYSHPVQLNKFLNKTATDDIDDIANKYDVMIANAQECIRLNLAKLETIRSEKAAFIERGNSTFDCAQKILDVNEDFLRMHANSLLECAGANANPDMQNKYLMRALVCQSTAIDATRNAMNDCTGTFRVRDYSKITNPTFKSNFLNEIYVVEHEGEFAACDPESNFSTAIFTLSRNRNVGNKVLFNTRGKILAFAIVPQSQNVWVIYSNGHLTHYDSNSSVIRDIVLPITNYLCDILIAPINYQW
jgi:hypothetical protein